MKRVAVLGVFAMALVVLGASRAQAAELDLSGATGVCRDTALGTCAAAGFSNLGGGYYMYSGLVWSVTTIQPTGSGYIDSFVRIQDAGPNPTNLVVDGHNTSGTRSNDEKPGPTFTHDIETGNIQTTTLPVTGAATYYQFLLDINQEGGDPLLALTGLEFCQSATANRTAADSCPGTLRYDLDGSTANDNIHEQTETPKNSVLLDYKKNHGSGSGDLFVYVPTSILPCTGGTNCNNGTKYLYLWSQFGAPENQGSGDLPPQNNDGYEEWAFIHKGQGSNEPFNPPGVPEPGSLILLGTGLLMGGRALRKRMQGGTADKTV